MIHTWRAPEPAQISRIPTHDLSNRIEKLGTTNSFEDFSFIDELGQESAVRANRHFLSPKLVEPRLVVKTNRLSHSYSISRVCCV